MFSTLNLSLAHSIVQDFGIKAISIKSPKTKIQPNTSNCQSIAITYIDSLMLYREVEVLYLFVNNPETVEENSKAAK